MWKKFDKMLNSLNSSWITGVKDFLYLSHTLKSIEANHSMRTVSSMHELYGTRLGFEFVIHHTTTTITTSTSKSSSFYLHTLAITHTHTHWRTLNIHRATSLAVLFYNTNLYEFVYVYTVEYERTTVWCLWRIVLNVCAKEMARYR